MQFLRGYLCPTILQWYKARDLQEIICYGNWNHCEHSRQTTVVLWKLQKLTSCVITAQSPAIVDLIVWKPPIFVFWAQIRNHWYIKMKHCHWKIIKMALHKYLMCFISFANGVFLDWWNVIELLLLLL
jgi:hypothetical protein